MLIAALVVLPAAGLAAWAWFVMAQVEDDSLSFGGFGGTFTGSLVHATPGGGNAMRTKPSLTRQRRASTVR